MDLPSIQGVEFRPIVGFPHYAAGSNGEIWSCRRGCWKKLNGMSGSQYGYRVVTLCGPGVQLRRYIHVLILETFKGPCPNGMQARHYPDGNVNNNAISNLQWGTPKQNSADRVEHGKDCRGTRHHWHGNVTEDLVRKIRADCSAGSALKDLAEKYPQIPKGNIWCIVKRKSWKHVA